MDEESARLNPELADTRQSTASRLPDHQIETLSQHGGDDEDDEQPAVRIERLHAEIDATRDDLGSYVSELDRRRHEALDLKLQVRKHPALAIGAGIAVAAVVAGVVVMVVRARRQETPRRKLERALERIAQAPVREGDGRMVKLLLKAALPIGVAVAKRLLSQRGNGAPPIR